MERVKKTSLLLQNISPIHNIFSSRLRFITIHLLNGSYKTTNDNQCSK
jgi:hypothetical protein